MLQELLPPVQQQQQQQGGKQVLLHMQLVYHMLFALQSMSANWPTNPDADSGPVCAALLRIACPLLKQLQQCIGLAAGQHCLGGGSNPATVSSSSSSTLEPGSLHGAAAVAPALLGTPEHVRESLCTAAALAAGLQAEVLPFFSFQCRQPLITVRAKHQHVMAVRHVWRPGGFRTMTKLWQQQCGS
jgi:hypothetical protein